MYTVKIIQDPVLWWSFILGKTGVGVGLVLNDSHEPRVTLNSAIAEAAPILNWLEQLFKNFDFTAESISLQVTISTVLLLVVWLANATPVDLKWAKGLG